MAKKYKFILTLPYEIELDSEDIDGHMSWPNYSQADPVCHRGIFDSREEAEKYAADFTPYSYTLINEDYNSFYSDDEGMPYYSIFDAEDAVCRYLGINPGDPYCAHPDSYEVEETEDDGEVAYKYRLFYEGECVYDSTDEGYYFDSQEKADDWANVDMEEYDIELGGLDEYYTLDPIDVVSIRVEEIEVED